MNQHKKLVLEALESYRGDNLPRALHAFRGFTTEELAEEHGHSGKTRAELLASYQDFDNQINDAIAWINNKD